MQKQALRPRVVGEKGRQQGPCSAGASSVEGDSGGLKEKPGGAQACGEAGGGDQNFSPFS